MTLPEVNRHSEPYAQVLTLGTWLQKGEPTCISPFSSIDILLIPYGFKFKVSQEQTLLSKPDWKNTQTSQNTWRSLSRMDLHDIKRSLQKQNGTSSLFPLDKQLRITQAKGHEIIALITVWNVENVEEGIAKLYRQGFLGESHGMFFLSHWGGEKNIYFVKLLLEEKTKSEVHVMFSCRWSAANRLRMIF